MSVLDRLTADEIDADDADLPVTIDIEREMAKLDERRAALREQTLTRFESALERLRIVRATAPMRQSTHSHVVINAVLTTCARPHQ